MTSHPVSSILCSPQPSRIWRTPCLSIPWCCLPTSSSICLAFMPFLLCLARWDLLGGTWLIVYYWLHSWWFMTHFALISPTAFKFQFNSVPLSIGSSGWHERRFSRYLLPVFSVGGLCQQFWQGQGCPLFDVAHPAFSMPTTASPLQVPWGMFLERLSWRVICPNIASVCLLAVANTIIGR